MGEGCAAGKNVFCHGDGKVIIEGDRKHSEISAWGLPRRGSRKIPSSATERATLKGAARKRTEEQAAGGRRQIPEK
jgi:hypothetical protein